VDPVNGQVRVLIEFDNPGEKVLPGMRVDLSAVAAPELAAEGQ
jgi:multidrug efflux pump subunit AcrA (membrane-fusion protein)